jgi:hypothetical protein
MKEETMDFEYIVGEDFDRAWLNFELDLPLKPRETGEPNPFYVDRPHNPLGELEDNLLAPFFKPPKFFFSGHRGCGKSTELLRLGANPQIREKYLPVHFTIRDEADINDLDFRDVLLSMAGQIYRTYHEEGGKLPKQMETELASWQGELVEEIERLQEGRRSFDIGGDLDAVFAKFGLKMKLEPATRTVIRQVFERNITGLIQIINEMSAAIQAETGRLPLVLIDDLDKPDLPVATEIFHDRREIMLQPNCAIVYTVSSALFYSEEFDAIRDQAIFLPNVKLHPEGCAGERYRQGYNTMRLFAYKRMARDLIAEDALAEAVCYSGGVFREMARIMRGALGRARRRGAGHVEIEDVHLTVNEIQNEYRRILTAEDRAFLKDVHDDNQLVNHERLRPLMQLLAILEYRNGKNWCDVHPTLVDLLKENGNGGNGN